MAQILEYLKIAFMNIKMNKGRSFLTMLGIIIGISSVILIITVGNGVKNTVNVGMDSLVGNQIQFDAVKQTEQGDWPELTMADFEEIKKTIPNVAEIYASGNFTAEMSNRRGDFTASLIVGTPGMSYMYKDQPIIRGRYFTDSEYYAASNVCVIHEDSARAMFGNVDVLGMTVEFNFYGMPIEMEIIGVREEEKLTGVLAYVAEMMEFEGGEKRVYIEVPETVLMARFGMELPGYSYFTAVAATSESQHQVAQDIMDYWEEKYDCKGKGLIRVENFGDYMDQMNQILDYITIFVAVVAAISLLVGGIGVMNIMLVSVTERTREIGIRKALGARMSSIMLQFLAESAIITLLGGVIGIALGVGGAYLLCGIVSINAKVSIPSVIGATLFSTAVGIFFGLYPAKKAAKLSPIEALRHE